MKSIFMFACNKEHVIY